jgi:hypothetical protein
MCGVNQLGLGGVNIRAFACGLYSALCIPNRQSSPSLSTWSPEKQAVCIRVLIVGIAPLRHHIVYESESGLRLIPVDCFT